MVALIRLDSGTRVKMLEARRSGAPSYSPRIHYSGAEGLKLMQGHDLEVLITRRVLRISL